MLQQAFALMRTVAYGEARYVRGQRHLQIVGRIADHKRALRVDAGVLKYIVQHLRMWFGQRLVGTARHAKVTRGRGIAQHPVQSAAGFAGRNRQAIAMGTQLLQPVDHARKQRGLGLIDMNKVTAIVLHHLLARFLIDPRQY